jgi:hypothetical protein
MSEREGAVKYDDLAGLVRVCAAGELEALTSYGWRLVASFQDEEVTRHDVEEPVTDEEERRQGKRYKWTTRHDVVRVTRFLLHKDENAARDAIMAQLAEANVSVAAALAESAQTKELLEGANKRLSEAEKKKDADALRIKDLESRLARSGTLEKKLETVRRAIGDRVFLEILPEEKKS